MRRSPLLNADEQDGVIAIATDSFHARGCHAGHQFQALFEVAPGRREGIAGLNFQRAQDFVRRELAKSVKIDVAGLGRLRGGRIHHGGQDCEPSNHNMQTRGTRVQLPACCCAIGPITGSTMVLPWYVCRMV